VIPATSKKIKPLWPECGVTGKSRKHRSIYFVARFLADGLIVVWDGNRQLNFDLLVILSGRAMRRKTSSRVAVLTFSLLPVTSSILMASSISGLSPSLAMMMRMGRNP